MYTVSDCNNLISDIIQAVALCNERAEVGRRNEGRINIIKEEMTKNQIQVRDIKGAVNHALHIEKNLESFLSNKKNVSLENLKIAISQANVIVPDADCAAVRLEVDGKDAMVVNERGQDINDREGAGYRTSMGILIRNAVIGFDPDALHVMLLDESFGPLSDESTDRMREVLKGISTKTAIVGIEQHAVLFNGLDYIEYNVQKGADKISRVRRCD